MTKDEARPAFHARVPNPVIVRPEGGADAEGIRAVHRAAFGRDDEGRLVDALRRAGVVIASVVAVADGQIVGHALFSTVWIDSKAGSLPVASLAPMAVRPERHREGIGTALASAGIQRCVEAGCSAVIVVGHPAYYPRFGFTPETVAHLESPYAGGAFMGRDLRRGFLARATGVVRYPAAFADLAG
jgi:putative acetyltransferase